MVEVVNLSIIIRFYIFFTVINLITSIGAIHIRSTKEHPLSLKIQPNPIAQQLALPGLEDLETSFLGEEFIR